MGVLDRLLGRPTPATSPTALSTPTTDRRVTAALSATWAPASRTLTSDTNRPSAVVYRCVQTIASNAASLDLVVRGRQGDIVPDHPTSVLFNRRPNPAYSARVLKEVLWSQMEYRGQAFCWLDRGPTGAGTTAEVWPVFDTVRPIIDGREGQPFAGTLVGYRADLADGRRVGLLPDEVLWLRYPHPTVAWAAQSPLQAASWAAELDAHAQAWQHGELRNGPGSNQVIFLGDLEEDQFHSTVALLRGQTDGPGNAGRRAFTSGTVKPEAVRLGLTAAEASYIDSRKVNAEEIALAFGVPRDLLFGQSTYDNQRAAKVNLWTDTIVPKLEVVAGEVDRQLLPDLAETAEFDVSTVDALQDNQDAISSRVRENMYTDVLLIDEGRAQLGLEPLPGGLGQMTLTVYRETMSARIAREFTPETAVRAALAPVAEQVARLLQPGLTVRPQLPAATRAVRVAAVDAEAVQRQYDAMTDLGIRAVRRLAGKQQEKVLQNAERNAARPEHTRVTPDEVFDSGFWERRTADELEGWLGQVWDGGAAQTARALGLSFDVFDQQVLEQMRARLTVLAEQVTATTRSAIEQALLEPGVEAGESVPDLAARLTAVFTDLSSWRAETIARTETVGGHNAASQLAASTAAEEDPELGMARRWLAADDPRVRDSHRDLDGHTTRGMDDPYPNGLMFPGDPTGPPAETINCRCVELYVFDDDDEELL